MTILTHAAQEKIDSTSLSNRSFVFATFFVRVACLSVQKMNVGWFDIDLGEEIRMHEMAIALRVISSETDIFIHIERDDISKRKVAGLVICDKPFVNPERRTSCGKTQNEPRSSLGIYPPLDVRGNPVACGIVIALNDNAHLGYALEYQPLHHLNIFPYGSTPKYTIVM
jgi:hypothetical protein